MAPEEIQTVYIVDDDESVRRGLKRLVCSAGMVAEIYASAEEFEDNAQIHLPACLVLDVHLSRMSGFDLNTRLSVRHPRLPVILMTAHDDAHTRQAADDRGLVVLRKPFDAERLLSMVQEALESSRPGL